MLLSDLALPPAALRSASSNRDVPWKGLEAGTIYATPAGPDHLLRRSRHHQSRHGEGRADAEREVRSTRPGAACWISGIALGRECGRGT